MRAFVILVVLLCANIWSGSAGGGSLQPEATELYNISQNDGNSTREERGYLVDGRLVVLGMYEFNGSDGYVHTTRFIADRKGYRARTSKRRIGSAPDGDPVTDIEGYLQSLSILGGKRIGK